MTERLIPQGTYNRIEALAGGAFAPPRAFARAFVSRLNRDARSHKHREARREIWADVLAMRAESQNLIIRNRL
jgi:hypothetical protein